MRDGGASCPTFFPFHPCDERDKIRSDIMEYKKRGKIDLGDSLRWNRRETQKRKKHPNPHTLPLFSYGTADDELFMVSW